MSRVFFCFFISAIALSACGDRSAPKKLEDCPAGKPKPVFSEQMPGVSGHRFTAESYSATEEFVLGDSMAIALIQSGCEQPVQEFRFSFSYTPDRDDPVFWVGKSVDALYDLSSLNAAVAPLAAWAQAIEAAPPNIILGEPFSVQQGIYVSVDRIKGASGVILLLTLGAQP